MRPWLIEQHLRTGLKDVGSECFQCGGSLPLPVSMCSVFIPFSFSHTLFGNQGLAIISGVVQKAVFESVSGSPRAVSAK